MERANGAKGEAALFKLNYSEVETQKMDFSLSSLASFFIVSRRPIVMLFSSRKWAYY